MTYRSIEVEPMPEVNPPGLHTHRAAHDAMFPIKLEKADPKVQYKLAADKADWRCGTCRFFDPMCGGCSLVEGTIDATWVCKLWTEQLDGQTATRPQMYHEPDFQVFINAGRRFAAKADYTKPQWIPFLPVPGDYKHPLYGDLDISKEQNEEMVASVKANVYQEHIPIDAEHKTKLSGAVGYLRDMRMNDDGSADALVEFTDRGQKLMAAGGYKYVSPEWYTDWMDPATEEVHQNVVIGGAITTRPFFKEKALRALVASEDGSTEVVRPDWNTKSTTEGDTEVPEDKDTKAAAPAPDDKQPVAKTFSEEDHQRLLADAVKAAEDKVRAEAQSENKTFGEMLDTEKQARQAAESRVAALEAKERHQRFSDLVAGRGGQNDGAPWAGDAGAHVEMLEALATRFGEADPVFTKYVEQNNAVAAQIKGSSLFSEIGTGASTSAGGEADIDGQLQAMAETRRKNDPSKTIQRHYAEALDSPEGKALYARKTIARGLTE